MNGDREQGYPYTRERWDDDATSRQRPPTIGEQRRNVIPPAPPPRQQGPPLATAISHSSAYEPERLSPYRSEPRGHTMPPPTNGYNTPADHLDHASTASGDDGPTYVLEHLATFRVSPEAGLVYPADGMRRLLHMEKTTGIWTQKMFLKLDRKWVFILSHENGDVVEKFPMELIREPTAFTSEDPKELYNNIFIFVVAEDSKRKYDNPTEMHIFQCLRISAKDVVEDMKLYMSGKALSGVAIRGGRGEQIPPAPQEPAPVPPLLGNGYRHFSDGEVRGESKGPRSERSSVSHNDEVSSTTSERYERDVAILNNCFDDIERFIARLQHTAAATKELERRRSRSRKSKKKDIGDGLLSMRAKPPPEREFMDIFQKFKLSFNLLAKLRPHIRDPNAAELVHFLFTPLALIVDASRDSYYEPSLPPQVISPLLTQDAVELLTNCLSSRETELWQSLDDAWLIPREVWKIQVPQYRPAFYSGWAPEINDEARERRYPMYPEKHEGDIRQGVRDDFDYSDSERRDGDGSSPPSDLGPPPRYRRDARDDRTQSRSMTPMSEYPLDEAETQNFDKGQRKWLDDLKSRQAKIVQVTYPRTANNGKELTVVRGEYLEVVDDSRRWWRAMNSRGQAGHVPHTIVTLFASEEQDQDIRYAGPPRPMQKDRVVYPDSNGDDELNARREGYIPSPPPPPPDTSRRQETNAAKSVPSQNTFGSTQSHTDLINEELKLVLEDFRKSRPHLEINKTPDVYIKQTSTPQEVQQWLSMKGFSERIQKQFDGVDGQRLFSLSRQQLEGFCGKSEGSRLASQITIQRNVSGYKTVRSTELKHVLEQQRKKLDISGKAKTTTDRKDSSQHQALSEPDFPDASRLGSRPSRSSTVQREQDNVSVNFKFLKQYETSEQGEDYESVHDSGDESSDSQSRNTLSHQIKNRQKKMVQQPSQIIASR